MQILSGIKSLFIFVKIDAGVRNVSLFIFAKNDAGVRNVITPIHMEALLGDILWNGCNSQLSWQSHLSHALP